MWTPSNTWASMSNRFIWSATRAGRPVAAMLGSVTTRTRRGQYRGRAWAGSSGAAGAHLRVDQDAAGAVQGQVVADLVGGAGAKLQQGCAVGEDGLRTAWERRGHGASRGSRGCQV